jgi:hypothetical protein
MDDLTALWYIKIFSDNSYFNNMPNSVIVEYNILENKDLSIVIKAPLYIKTFLVSLDKEMKSCVTYTDYEETIENVDIFSIEYE